MADRARIATPEAWERWGWMVESVAQRHGVTVDAVLGSRRTSEVARARHDLMAGLYGSGLAYAEIGRLLGRDHTSVMHGVRRAL